MRDIACVLAKMGLIFNQNFRSTSGLEVVVLVEVAIV